MINISKHTEKILYSISSIIILSVLFLIPYNYFVTSTFFYQTTTESYFLNLLTANNISDFQSISSIIKQIILGKDIIIGIVLGMIQVLFLVSMIFYKKNSNVYIYNLALIGNILSFIFVFALILLHDKFSTNITIISKQMYMLLFLVLLESIVTLIMTFQAIEKKIKSSLPFSYDSFQNLLYCFTQWLLSFVCFSLIIIILGSTLIYQLCILLVNFSEYQVLQLIPSTIQLDLLKEIPNLSLSSHKLLNLFEFNNIYLTIQQGILSVSPKEVLQNIGQQLNDWFHLKFHKMIMPFIYLLISYFIAGGIQVIGYKRNNSSTPIWSSIVIMISGGVSLVQGEFIFTLVGSLLLILGFFYLLLSVDQKFYDSEYTNSIFNILNKRLDKYFGGD